MQGFIAQRFLVTAPKTLASLLIVFGFFSFGEAADSVAPAVILALCFVRHLGPGHAHCPNMQSVSLHFLLQWWSLWSSASLLNFLMKGICGVQFLVG